MFEHLDDPEGFRPDRQLRTAAVSRGRRLRLRRRLLTAAGAVTLVALSAGVGGALYVDRRDAAIDRVDVATEPSLDGATNVLLVGTDARAEAGSGVRADTIAVVRIEPDGSVKLLSLPRDLVDPRTGERLSQAGSAADDPGAARRARVESVTRMTGIPVNHYVELDFEGLSALVDEAGGLRLAVDAPLVDERAGLHLPASSCATLDGRTALALVRARNVDGWGDFGRMARAQAVIGAALAQLKDVATGPAELDRLSRILADHATVDDGLSLGRMVELGRAVAPGPGVVRSVMTPVLQTPGGGTLVLAPEARAVFQEFGAPPSADAGTGPGTAAPDGASGGEPLPAGAPTAETAGIRPC